MLKTNMNYKSKKTTGTPVCRTTISPRGEYLEICNSFECTKDAAVEMAAHLVMIKTRMSLNIFSVQRPSTNGKSVSSLFLLIPQEMGELNKIVEASQTLIALHMQLLSNAEATKRIENILKDMAPYAVKEPSLQTAHQA